MLIGSLPSAASNSAAVHKTVQLGPAWGHGMQWIARTRSCSSLSAALSAASPAANLDAHEPSSIAVTASAAAAAATAAQPAAAGTPYSNSSSSSSSVSKHTLASQRQRKQRQQEHHTQQQEQQQQQHKLQSSSSWRSKLSDLELQQLFASEPKVLTCYIKASSSWQQLQQLLTVAGTAANHIHLAAAVVHCAQLQQQQGSSSSRNEWMLRIVQQLLQQHSAQLSLRHTANLLWALAVSCSSSSSSTELLSSLVSSLLLQQSNQLLQQQQQRATAAPAGQVTASLKPQDLSNSIWALATLQHQPPLLWLELFLLLSQQQLYCFNLQELSNTAWGLAKLKAAVPHDWQQAFLAAAEQQLARIQQQQAGSDGRTGSSSSSNMLGQCQAVANIAHAVASIGWTPSVQWQQQFYAASQRLLQHFTVQQLSMTLWAVAEWCLLLPLLPPSSWVAAHAAAVQQQQQQQHVLTDQAVVNIAASCYKILLTQQMQQQRGQYETAVVTDEEQTDLQQQLQHVLGLMLHAAAGRVQTLPATAAAALAWASAGINSSSRVGLQQQQQQQQGWLQQYVAVHTSAYNNLNQQQQQRSAHSTYPATAAAAAMVCSQELQLLWLCAKAHRLPTSADWCAAACATVSQALHKSNVGAAVAVRQREQQQQQHALQPHQVAQLSWSLARLLMICKQQRHSGSSSSSTSAGGSSSSSSSTTAESDQSGHVGRITESVTQLAGSLMAAMPQQLQHMNAKQYVEATVSSARLVAAVAHLQQQQEAAAVVQAAATAAGIHATEMTVRQQQLVLQAVHALLLRCPQHAAADQQLQQTLDNMFQCIMQQQKHHAFGASAAAAAVESVTLALRVLAVAQVPTRLAAVAAASHQQAAAAAPPDQQQQQLLPLVQRLPGSAIWQQQVVAALRQVTGLDAVQLLKAMQLCARLRVVLPASAVNDLFYSLQEHITAGSYSPRQLLHILIALRHWRIIPRSSTSVRTSLINAWLAMTQQCMFNEIRLRLQLQQSTHRTDVDRQPGGADEADAAQQIAAVQFDGDLVCMMALGLARLHLQPPEQWMQLYIQLLLQLLPAVSPDHLSKVMIGMATLDYRPPDQAAELLLQRCEQLLPSMSTKQLVRVMHSLPKLHLSPSDACLQTFYEAVAATQDRLQVSGFGMVVWALAKIGAKPDHSWMEQLLHRTFTQPSDNSSVTAVAARLKPQHLANILCAFAQLRFTPGADWMAWFRIQLGQQAGALQELDHFHIEWAWRELHEQ